LDVEQVGLFSQGHEADVKIKWPNDIYYRDQKIGGVLLNSSFHGPSLRLIIGVGLNVLNEEPTIYLQQILNEIQTEIENHEVYQVTLEEVLAEILNDLESSFQIFEESGFASMEQEYLSYWMHSNQKLTLESQETVTIKGITKNGYLLAETSSGSKLELMPDGNTIDMLQGLIIRRL